jgi:hypothetical protein
MLSVRRPHWARCETAAPPTAAQGHQRQFGHVVPSTASRPDRSIWTPIGLSGSGHEDIRAVPERYRIC